MILGRTVVSTVIGRSFTSTLTPSQPAEASRQSASRSASSSTSLERLADEGLDQQRAGFASGMPRASQIEQQVLVDLAAGRAVAADHVVGEDLELGLGIELGRLRQHQRLRHLLAVGLLRAGRTMTLPWNTPRASSSSTPLNSSRLVQRGTRGRPPASCRNAAGRAARKAPEMSSSRPFAREAQRRSGCGPARRRSRTGRRRSARRRQARPARWRDAARPSPSRCT